MRAVFLFILYLSFDRILSQDVCDTSSCTFTLVESIPDNLTYADGSASHLSMFDGWMNLMGMATESIDIASYYWTLRGVDIWEDSSDYQGEQIYQFISTARDRGINVRIVQDVPTYTQPSFDTEELKNSGAAEVRTLNMERLVGGGILHTKMFIVDNTHFFVGSTNFDWRSFTQVKELGMVVYNCSCLAQDMFKLFTIYWEMAIPTNTVPESWPTSLDTAYNKDTPLPLIINGTESSVFLASSPPKLCTDSRTSDIDSILHVINKATKFIYIAVMDYIPAILYADTNTFWPVIDDALRKAAYERGVEVKLLASHWAHTRPDNIPFLKSLAAVNNSYSPANVEVNMFVVPSFTKEQANVPYARVNHNKYMVTDSVAYIGTSNWSGSYFTNTAGIGLIVNQTMSDSQPIREQLEAVFLRDWNSPYSFPISHFETPY